MAGLNISKKIIQSHLLSGKMIPGEEIEIKIDQTLAQDATGTLVMLELESLGLDRAKTELSVQYVDHNLLELDHKNAEDHIYLRTAAEKFGIWYSRPGNGISHPIHTQQFAVPGKTLLGADSHTPSAGALGMLAIGSGGLDVALAIAGKPYPLVMPKICGVELKGKLQDWVSAKDIILDMLRRIGVRDGKGWIFEYSGEGLNSLSVMDRLVIANMGTEMGATTSIFPSDKETLHFMKNQNRDFQWKMVKAEEGAEYDKRMEIDLSIIEPLIALPGSPGKVVRVKEVEDKPIHQVVIGSSANPGLRDYVIVSEIIKGKIIPAGVSFDINPSTRQITENLSINGHLLNLLKSGARFHQAGCLGCIGMGQAPATGKISLRTMPRNFPGRSGTLDDQVYLCSPETAAASALNGRITDPRNLEKILGIKYPKYTPPKNEIVNTSLLIAPIEKSSDVQIEKGSNIQPLPEIAPLKTKYLLPVIFKAGDDISTDEIVSGGSDVLPLRSNIPEISKWVFHQLDIDFHARAIEAKKNYGGHILVAGKNYAQGSSREHAALAPKFLGQVAIIARSYARIGWQNLINYGIIPFEFADEKEYDKIKEKDMLVISNLSIDSFRENHIEILNKSQKHKFHVTHHLNDRQIQVILEGGMINDIKKHSHIPEEVTVLENV